MTSIKEWIKDHKTEIYLGAILGVAVVAGGAAIAYTRKNGVGSVALPPRPYLDPSAAPAGFEKHDYAGLISMGPEGDLWAHPDSNPPGMHFKIGHVDAPNHQVYYTEYPHDGPMPELLEKQPPANAA